MEDGKSHFLDSLMSIKIVEQLWNHRKRINYTRNPIARKRENIFTKLFVEKQES